MGLCRVGLGRVLDLGCGLGYVRGGCVLLPRCVALSGNEGVFVRLMMMMMTIVTMMIRHCGRMSSWLLMRRRRGLASMREED